VIKQLESQGIAGGGLFAELLVKRETQNSDEENRIMSEITKATQGKPEESAAAAAKLDQFEDKVSRIAGLEAELMKEYEIALVDEEGDHYKVVIASEGLEKKQAAEIIKKVMGTMEVAANQVSVQYVTQ
jgi:stage III sporulation protein AH